MTSSEPRKPNRGHKPVSPDEFWHDLLTGDDPALPLREIRNLFTFLPGHARCKFCQSPFDGAFAPILRVLGRGPSRLSAEFCEQCQEVAQANVGGAEVDLTLLFADVRGSTRLGEQMKPAEFSRLISRFFSASGRVLLDTHAWVDRLVGDQVIGIYLPYFVGPEPVQTAIHAAQQLLHATGHDDPAGPWIQVGVGIHSGTAFMGTVGSIDGVTDITVLGDTPNVAARLSSAAAAGEILLSEDAFRGAGPAAFSRGGGGSGAGITEPLEVRQLELKGKSQPMSVHVMKGTAPQG